MSYKISTQVKLDKLIASNRELSHKLADVQELLAEQSFILNQSTETDLKGCLVLHDDAPDFYRSKAYKIVRIDSECIYYRVPGYTREYHIHRHIYKPYGINQHINIEASIESFEQDSTKPEVDSMKTIPYRPSF